MKKLGSSGMGSLEDGVENEFMDTKTFSAKEGGLEQRFSNTESLRKKCNMLVINQTVVIPWRLHFIVKIKSNITMTFFDLKVLVTSVARGVGEANLANHFGKVGCEGDSSNMAPFYGFRIKDSIKDRANSTRISTKINNTARGSARGSQGEHRINTKMKGGGVELFKPNFLEFFSV